MRWDSFLTFSLNSKRAINVQGRCYIVYAVRLKRDINTSGYIHKRGEIAFWTNSLKKLEHITEYVFFGKQAYFINSEIASGCILSSDVFPDILFFNSKIRSVKISDSVETISVYGADLDGVEIKSGAFVVGSKNKRKTKIRKCVVNKSCCIVTNNNSFMLDCFDLYENKFFLHEPIRLISPCKEIFNIKVPIFREFTGLQDELFFYSVNESLDGSDSDILLMINNVKKSKTTDCFVSLFSITKGKVFQCNNIAETVLSFVQGSYSDDEIILPYGNPLFDFFMNPSKIEEEIEKMGPKTKEERAVLISAFVSTLILLIKGNKTLQNELYCESVLELCSKKIVGFKKPLRLKENHISV